MPVAPDVFAAFLERYPEYDSTGGIDRLRASEYGRLDAQGHVYLDYTGGSLHADSQVREHLALLTAHVFGNPHSVNPTSAATTHYLERTRRAVLDWFNAGDEYVAIFTPNATGALKLVAESYPFAAGARLLLSVDNHNSVNGIREFARAAGAAVDYVPLTVPELRLDREALDRQLAAPAGTPRLFAFPAQSNFSGVQHPLEAIAQAQALGWDVLLDAAAFAPTNRLDLRAARPDFVSVSFYKMFGYPTGVGCLLVRRQTVGRLRRPWFAGGTVNFATVQGRTHILSPDEAGFEDGTLDYLAIPAVEIGLRHLQSIGLDTVRRRVRCLTGWLLEQLLALEHANGRPMVRLYGPVTTQMRGAIVTMNFYDPQGHLVDYRRVEELARAERISLRTGCFCNPGAGETAEAITAEDVALALREHRDLTLARFLQVLTRRGKTAGAVRVSFGIASTFEDARRFLAFAGTLRDQTRLALGEATFDIVACRVIRDGS